MDVKFAEWADRQADVAGFDGRLNILDVVRIDVLEVGQDHLVDREIDRTAGTQGWKFTTVRESFGDETIEFLATRLG
jgi:hypothetical protein